MSVRERHRSLKENTRAGRGVKSFSLSQLALFNSKEKHFTMMSRGRGRGGGVLSRGRFCEEDEYEDEDESKVENIFDEKKD